MKTHAHVLVRMEFNDYNSKRRKFPDQRIKSPDHAFWALLLSERRNGFSMADWLQCVIRSGL